MHQPASAVDTELPAADPPAVVSITTSTENIEPSVMAVNTGWFDPIFSSTLVGSLHRQGSSSVVVVDGDLPDDARQRHSLVSVAPQRQAAVEVLAPNGRVVLQVVLPGASARWKGEPR